ncbi:MAG: 30S ribosomal protein S8 [Candidatus Niyogibacteria bacterium]|nr:30S ribosomal protein S8 [Candidatus Niyogibacteria bacterium]
MDPLADMFTQVVNASRAGKERVLVPYSKIKFEIAGLLHKEKYLAGVARRGKKNKRILEMKLSYDESGSPLVHSARLVSKQSARAYGGWRDLKRRRINRGMLIVSTPKGIMTHKEAWKQKVGGEIIVYVF